MRAIGFVVFGAALLIPAVTSGAWLAAVAAIGSGAALGALGWWVGRAVSV